MNINDPNYAKTMAACKKQANAYYELMGGDNAMMGNNWDPWNVIGISWKLYNQYKTERGYTDEQIAEAIKFSKPFPELDKLKARVAAYKMR